MAYYEKSDLTKAELLQLKLTPIICLMNFISKKVGSRKTKPSFIIVEY